MGEKDIVERQLEDHADVFADIVNVLLFRGEQRVRPEELMETGMRSQYKADTGTHHERRINLYEISHLTEEQLEQFQSDFGAVAEYFVRSKDAPEYCPAPRPIRHVDEFLKMMSVFTGDRRYEEMTEDFDGKEEVTMCDVLDYRERIGQEKGERIGREQGERIGREQGERIGRRAGEDSMRKLFSRLLKEKKMDEFNRALEDAAFCEQLLKGYGLG